MALLWNCTKCTKQIDSILPYQSVQLQITEDVKMGDSRKYPHPATDGFHLLTPPCVRKFQNELSPRIRNSVLNNPPSSSEFPFFSQTLRKNEQGSQIRQICRIFRQGMSGD